MNIGLVGARVVLVVVSIVLMIGPLQARDTLPMTQLLFSESEPGIDHYQTRILVGQRFLRIDEGDWNDDFILYDRLTNEVHSFSHGPKTHLIMTPEGAKEVEFELDFKVENKTLEEAPSINGEKPVEYHYYADGEECMQSINVEGLLEDAADALAGYQRALAMHSSKTFDRLPAAMKTSCFMANNYLFVDAFLTRGFPMHVIDYLGKEKRLLSFQQVDVPSAAIEFPVGYREYHPAGLQ